jgi:group I intron endonuclease
VTYRIYLVTNLVNDKKYVGFTQRSVLSRWRSHCNDARNKKGWALHSAIRKYGVDQFMVSELYEGHDKAYTLNVMEPHFILQMNSNVWGYNLTHGGDGAKGYRHSEDHIISLRRRMSGSGNPMFGRFVSAETKQIWSKERKGKNNSRAGVYVVKYLDGRVENIDDLAKWCDLNQLPHSTARACIRRRSIIRTMRCSITKVINGNT